MPDTVTARARDGTEHLVSAARTPEGRWCVLDSVADSTIVVETLTGHDDRQAQARAVALDYAAEQQAFQLGLRAHDPLPKPRPAIAQGPAMGSLTADDPILRVAGSQRPADNQDSRSALRIVRPQPAGLRCRVRLADGRVFTGELPPARHRAIQLGMLHADTAELVELTPARAAPTANPAHACRSTRSSPWR